MFKSMSSRRIVGISVLTLFLAATACIRYSGRVTIFTGQSSQYSKVLSADFDKDNKIDLLGLMPPPSSGTSALGTVYFAHNDSTADALSLQFSSAYFAGYSASDAAAVADFNQDGYPDVIVANYYVSQSNFQFGLAILQNNGPAADLNNRFIQGRIMSSGIDNPGLSAYSPKGLIPHFLLNAADVNNDGRPDLLMAYNYFDGSGVFRSSAVTTYINTGSGINFTRSATIPFGMPIYTLKTGDFNGDHRLDWALGMFSTTRAYEYYLATIINNGSPTNPFLNNNQGYIQLSRSAIYGFEVSDMNHDGKSDVVAGTYREDTSSGTYNVVGDFLAYYAAADGSGRLNNPVTLVPQPLNGFTSEKFLADDLDSNGLIDVVAVTIGDQGMHVFENTLSGLKEALVDNLLPGGTSDIIAADLTGDGFKELIAPTRANNSSNQPSGALYIYRNSSIKSVSQ